MLKSIFLKYRHTLLNITQSVLKVHIKSLQIIATCQKAFVNILLIHGDILILVCLYYKEIDFNSMMLCWNSNINGGSIVVPSKSTEPRTFNVLYACNYSFAANFYL